MPGQATPEWPRRRHGRRETIAWNDNNDFDERALRGGTPLDKTTTENSCLAVTRESARMGGYDDQGTGLIRVLEMDTYVELAQHTNTNCCRARACAKYFRTRWRRLDVRDGDDARLQTLLDMHHESFQTQLLEDSLEAQHDNIHARHDNNDNETVQNGVSEYVRPHARGDGAIAALSPAKTGRLGRPRYEKTGEATVTRQCQWIQWIRPGFHFESDAATTTTTWVSSQCDLHERLCEARLSGRPTLYFKCHRKTTYFDEPSDWSNPFHVARKKDPGLRLTRFDSVDGCMDVAKLDVKTRWLARTWLRCDGAATQNERKDEEIGHSNSKCTGV